VTRSRPTRRRVSTSKAGQRCPAFAIPQLRTRSDGIRGFLGWFLGPISSFPNPTTTPSGRAIAFDASPLYCYNHRLGSGAAPRDVR
jgi:hypothetical protein